MHLDLPDPPRWSGHGAPEILWSPPPSVCYHVLPSFFTWTLVGVSNGSPCLCIVHFPRDCPVPGLLFLTLKNITLFILWWWQGMQAMACMEVKGQPTGVNSFSPQCGFWGSESGHHSWQQAPLPTEPPHLPVFVLKSSVIIYKLQPRLVSVCQPSALVGIRGMCHFLWFCPCLRSHAGSSQTIICLSAGQAPSELKVSHVLQAPLRHPSFSPEDRTLSIKALDEHFPELSEV